MIGRRGSAESVAHTAGKKRATIAKRRSRNEQSIADRCQNGNVVRESVFMHCSIWNPTDDGINSSAQEPKALCARAPLQSASADPLYHGKLTRVHSSTSIKSKNCTL